MNISTTGAFTASETTVTIPANKGEQTVTFTAPAELGAATGTVTFTPTAAGLEPVTLNISGTVRDPEKMFEDFSGNALPEDGQQRALDLTQQVVLQAAMYGTSLRDMPSTRVLQVGAQITISTH